ncbi:MAG: hypothetical protein F6J87_21690 [Spirulina sp. SIO3F2]|nr:hypothetical protein [Spirulina sp. SIO3F2]
MSFSDYKTLEQVQAEYQIAYQEQQFLTAQELTIAESFWHDLAFNLENMDVFASEAARCELIILPILREVYKQHHHTTALWVQRSLTYDAQLCGTPDYMLSQKSELGKTVLGLPILMITEAKKNDFEQGWAQCLAELIAGNRLNPEKHPIYGIVTDGKTWEFGYLDQQLFTKETRIYTISDPERLVSIINALFILSIQAAHH